MRHLPVVLALVVPFTTPATAQQEMPTRKAGLWELKMVHEGRNLPMQQIKQCTDQATDKLMNTNFGSMAQDTCPEKNIQRSGNTITIDAVCKIGGVMTTTSRSVITGDFDSSYNVKVTTKMTGGPAIPGMTPGGEMQMTIEAKYVGACEAGQKPGDIIMGNGMKMNVQNLPKLPSMGGSDSMMMRGSVAPGR